MIKETDYKFYFEALLKGDKEECIKIANHILSEGADIKEIYFDLLQKSMYSIGDMWENNRTSIAEERIASDITANIIDLIYPHVILKPKKGLKILIACVDKEHHSMGARIISDYIELNGWKSIFLGANVPCSEIIDSIKIYKPDVVGISSNYYLNLPRLIKLVEEINNKYPGQEIIVGGQVFINGGTGILEKYENVNYIASIEDLEEFIERHKGNGTCETNTLLSDFASRDN